MVKVVKFEEMEQDFYEKLWKTGRQVKGSRMHSMQVKGSETQVDNIQMGWNGVLLCDTALFIINYNCY